ncbi:hypothetical protein LY28_03500 [Ruminiclostridium sufflavum DSM 19573]|uniref:Uncharacterized protein n=1 Tax=Ruminiclostridium sufflavum DSM 19573 TaxID=1121337 RepID=A0A318XJ52_9FIRM|nr:hypothetical protein [Ruminiclostridium sufflavum]PYG84879.1 hypothetical protein LY28_03500 [Ruminiclostridium sufflavum DSM 19573]
MQDKDKISEIRNILNRIAAVNDLYSDENKGFYFDYDTVIQLLRQADEVIDSSARCPRPDNVPAGILWCEKMCDGGEDEFDPFVYRGYISTKDFRKVQNAYFEDRQADRSGDEDEEFEV